MPSRRAGQIQRFEMTVPALCTEPPGKKRPSEGLLEHGTHEVSSCIEVMNGHDQLAELRLPEVVRQELCIPLRQIIGSWLGDSGCAPHDLPQPARKMIRCASHF